MKNVKQTLVFAILFIAANFSHAQTANWCGAMENIERQMQSNPQMQQQMQEMKTFLQQAQTNRATNLDASTVYIPVVFHIVHNGDALGTGENITDAQCISQLTVMNLHYIAQDPSISNVPPAFAPLVGNVNVQFCLAKFDPDGNPTTGIVRHSLSNTSWNDENDIDNTLKPVTIWDRNKYLNIWSVRMGG